MLVQCISPCNSTNANTAVQLCMSGDSTPHGAETDHTSSCKSVPLPPSTKTSIAVAFSYTCCSCVSQLVGVNTRYTGLGRCARAVGALHSSHELCTPARSRIQRRRCLTSTGRSVRTPKTAAKPSTSGLWPISGHVERLVRSVSGLRIPPPTPEVVP